MKKDTCKRVSFSFTIITLQKKRFYLYYSRIKVYNEINRNIGGQYYGCSYNKLFKLLIDKGWKKTEFANNAGISQNTLAKLSKNENVSLDVLIRICRTLNCTVDEMMDILPIEELND